MDNSLSAYTQKYDKEGYGLQYPDGHVIRFYERILKYKLSKTSGKLLDFGCGNGVHSKYFKNITGGGIEPYGIDIVPSLKKVWEKDPCLDSKNFHIISPNSSFKKLFNTKMDFIFATMMSDKGYSMYERGELMDNGLREVKGCPSGRLSGSSYIRFTKDIEELKEDFKPFKPLFWGDYELINLYNFEGSVEHFIYIGQK
ncbi:methyltransferase [Campylobacter jejuni]|nr:methyltransferase domain-containing protein [Campylobacter jejuni]HEC1701138.1 methyltransferase domain-containing protein [Campylobacter jejuni]